MVLLASDPGNIHGHPGQQHFSPSAFQIALQPDAEQPRCYLDDGADAAVLQVVVEPLDLNPVPFRYFAIQLEPAIECGVSYVCSTLFAVPKSIVCQVYASIIHWHSSL